jgi:hypothetical protein
VSNFERSLAPPPPAPPQHRPAPAPSGFSTAAFVMAAISVLVLPIVFGPMGIVFAILALAKGQPRAGAALAAAVIAPLMGMLIGAVIGAGL